MKKFFLLAAGGVAGIVCGLLGVGGGIFAQPLLAKSGMDARGSHAACVAVIGAVCIPPALLAAVRSPSLLGQLLPYLPGTVLGAVAAGRWMNKIPQPVIRMVFGLSLAASALRLALS